MSDDRVEPGGGRARRRFLQTAGLAAAGFTLARRPAWALGAAERGAAGDDCGCDAAPALPVYAAAYHQGAYFALASTGAGLGLFALEVDASLRVSLGARLEVELPDGFQAASLGVAGGRLLLTGGLPFTWSTWEADDEADAAVKDAMLDWPAHVPQAGRRVIEAPGLRPAAYALEFPYARPLALPELPRRVFGVLSGVAESADGLALLYEHSGALSESWYASSVDVLVRRGRAWSVEAAGEGLGESGPNLLARDGASLLVGLRTFEGTSFVRPGASRSASSAPEGRVLALVSGAAGVALLTAEAGGAARGWSSDGSAWRRRAELRLPDDEILAALQVSGAPGQALLLGRRSASLVEENAVLWGRTAGGERHVV